MITIELLKSWNPCHDGFARFCQLFPDGTDLFTAGERLAEDGHGDWGSWLYDKSRNAKMFEEVTVKGYQNTGYQNTGDQNTGNQNTGKWNTGDQNTGNWNASNQNTGNWNAGNQNTGNLNTGNQNTGNWNAGNQNTGNWNAGDQNTGNWNAGNQNTGNQNAGNWNAGNQNTGFFNTDSPTLVRVFGKDCDVEIWGKAVKPSFLFFDLTYWVNESEMSEEDKKADPHFHIRGGQLRKKDYKEAFIESWNNADKDNRELVRKLPNFDAEIFYQISGIDLRTK